MEVISVIVAASILLFQSLALPGIIYYPLKTSNNGISQFIILQYISFIWSVVIIGGSIIITLIYVSWRKYKGLKKQRKREPYR